MVINKSFKEIKNNITAYENSLEYPKKPEGYRKENYVYDENKSVKWNREHREELEKEYEEKRDRYRKEDYDLELQFKEDMINATKKEFNLNEKQAELIFNRSWEEGHSDGYESVVDEMIRRLVFIAEVNDLK